jgi:hypothetical protein
LSNGQRGRYNVEKLIADDGDAKPTELLVRLANCPRARWVSIHDRCKVVYEGSVSTSGRRYSPT